MKVVAIALISFIPFLASCATTGPAVMLFDPHTAITKQRIEKVNDSPRLVITPDTDSIAHDGSAVSITVVDNSATNEKKPSLRLFPSGYIKSVTQNDKSFTYLIEGVPSSGALDVIVVGVAGTGMPISDAVNRLLKNSAGSDSKNGHFLLQCSA